MERRGGVAEPPRVSADGRQSAASDSSAGRPGSGCGGRRARAGARGRLVSLPASCTGFSSGSRFGDRRAARREDRPHRASEGTFETVVTAGR